MAFGVLAFAVDAAPEAVARFVTPIVSSGFAWAFAAFLAGLTANTVRTAILRACTAPVLATVTYYGLILLVSRRWEHGDVNGLRSVAVASAVWLVVSVCVGLVMGLSAQLVKHGTTRAGTIAAGLTGGLLTAHGAYGLVHAVFVWVGPMDSFAWGRVQSALVQVVLAVVASIVVVRVVRREIAWPLFLITAVLSLAAGTGGWHLVESVRLQL